MFRKGNNIQARKESWVLNCGLGKLIWVLKLVTFFHHLNYQTKNYLKQKLTILFPPI